MNATLRTCLPRVLALCALALGALPASGDDRELLRASSSDPYVMILFDTSGSMNWSTKCTAEDMAQVFDHDFDTEGNCADLSGTPCVPLCSQLCPNGDCETPRNGDDPASKFRQAKEALYTVVNSLDNVNFGFATYNQNDLGVFWKQWLYRASRTPPASGFFTLAGGDQFPLPGSEEVFGQTFGCDRGNGNAEIGCYPDNNDAADTNDLWEMTKVRRLPKLGDDVSQTVTYYVRSGGTVYRVRTSNPSGQTAAALGAPTIQLEIRLDRCLNDSCSSRTHIDTRTFDYEFIGDFVKWENSISKPNGGYDAVAYSTASGTCNGWDPNTDTNSDDYDNYSLRFPNGGLTYDPPGTANDEKFRIGDVLPLNWLSTQKQAVLDRLAPRLAGAPMTSDPEAFAVATYLNDHRDTGQNALRLKNSALRPLFPSGSTPLGYSLRDIRTWFRGCYGSTNCSGQTGWDDIASEQDPDWECRRKYVLVLTDGDDTCSGGDPCNWTRVLHDNDGVTTFVVAFGLESSTGNVLECMAENGGSGAPIYAQNRAQLITALRDIFEQIQEESVAFASAAVPSVQSNIADKIYLSSFTPLNDASVWPGRLDAFLKPLPTDEEGLPDRGTLCSPGTVDAECFAFDAGDSQPAWDGDAAGYDPRGLLLQAPFPEDITRFDNTSLQIGTGLNERRVFFGLPTSTAAGKRQYFQYPGDNATQAEFEYAWNLPNPGVGDATNLTTIATVVESTLAEKRAEITDPETGTTSHMQYVMGDIFHANPTVVNAPADFDFYTKNLYYGQALCGDTDPAQTALRGPKLSYAWFSNKNLCRRVMLFAGSNDGQLHAFDGGIYEGTNCKLDLPQWLRTLDPTLGLATGDDPLDGEYTIGTGRELFSFIPGAMMPHVKNLAETSVLGLEYGIDNTPRIADVFIDPVPDASGNPTCVDREWRTVLLGTYREGGPGIFALDITQPDIIDTGSNIPQPIAGSPAYVPSCTNGGPNCGPLPFPSLLWEFSDLSDEDGNGLADLGESWSRPVVGRIQVCNGPCDSPGEPEDRYVAVFGGGLPVAPANSAADAVGNWIYMVDVETGRILYKRGGANVIEGAVAADVTVVDRNSNSLLDTLYFGTTAGFVYKVALGEGPFELGADGRIPDPTGASGRFNPFKVFTTGGRPIYLEINSIYVTRLRQNALLFGTGNRWNLWDFGGLEARFYVIVDSDWKDGGADGVTFDGLIDPVGCATCTQPLTELVLQPIDPDSAFEIENPGPSYLFGNPNPDLLAGWYFPLPANDKLITEPFTISGVTFFTMYDPVANEADGVCAKGGESKLFIVNVANAVGLAPGSDDFERYTTVPAFTTQPFAESSGTQNPGEPAEESCMEDLSAVNHELRKLQPETCRFASHTIDIRTIRSDTGIVCIAPVPICVEGHNWKEY